MLFLKYDSELVKEDIIAYLNYNNNNKINPSFISRYMCFTKGIKLFVKNVNGFRDLFYYRTEWNIIKKILYRIFKPTDNLILDCGYIAGGGAIFHHAFSTYLNIEHVGYGCTFRNNTTFGNKIVNGKLKRPWLNDNVFVGPNAVVIGDVTIGNNVIIGAGSVVTKDVPDNSTVVGNPAYIIKKDGVKCKIKL